MRQHINESVLEIIEPEAEVVDSIRSGNVPVQSIHPGLLPCPQGISTQRERIRIQLRPIDNIIYLPLLCHGHQWLSGKST